MNHCMNVKALGLIGFGLLATIGGVGCSKTDEGGTASTSTTASGSFKLSFSAASAGQRGALASSGSSARLASRMKNQSETKIAGRKFDADFSSLATLGTTTYSAADFINSSIASGPTSSMTLTVKKIAFGTSAGGAPVPIFNDTNGKALVINGSSIDMSNLFTTFDCVDIHGDGYVLKDGESCDCGFDTDNNPLGEVTWTTTSAESGTVEHTGCPWEKPTTDLSTVVEPGGGGKFASVTADLGTYTKIELTVSRSALVSGCVTGQFRESSVNNLHEYCTQTAYSILKATGGGENVNFEDQTAEEMIFDLDKPGSNWSTDGDDLTLTFPIKGGFELKAGESPQLSLVIDTNRMLRYYNTGTESEEKGPNPGAPYDIAYFFTSVFSESVFAFAGTPGGIRGYQWITKACTNVEDASVPTNKECTDGHIVAGWLTVILDSDGNPIVLNAMPDDDNALTVIKGGNFVMSTDGTVSYNTSSFVETSTGSGVYDMTYSLSGASGTLYGVDLNQEIGTEDVGYFRSDATFQHGYGLVTIIRQL